jgi:large subunit ribosomal protein L9
MRVILKQDIASLGVEGDIADVAPGYARNYLFPKRIAVEANKSNLKQLEQKRKALEKKEAERKGMAETEADKLQEKTVVIMAKAGTGGKLYGSVTSKDIAAAVKEQLGVDVDRKSVLLDESLKSLGTFAVSIKLHTDVEASVNVDVQPSEETKPKEEKTETTDNTQE